MYIDYNEMRVLNQMNSTNIEYINIYGLFNRYNIELPFEKEVNIFIGENGLGKTTILNCIYYLLEKKFSKLAEVNFNEIHVKFKNESMKHEITFFDIQEYNNRKGYSRRRLIDEDYLKKLIDNMLQEVTKDNLFSFEGDIIEYLSRRLSRYEGIPISTSRHYIIEHLNNNHSKKSNAKSGNVEKVKKLIQSIDNSVKQNIIYLPTYRRIENDFGKLNIDSDKLEDSELLIRFGMSDVQHNIKELLTKIKNESIEGFNKMTGILLKQYTDGETAMIEKSKYLPLDSEIVNIVLNRLGEKIETEYKQKIVHLIETHKMYEYEYFHLHSLLEKLILNYSNQKEYDDCIKNFVKTCNKYLAGKKFHYNESDLSLDIFLEQDGKLVDKPLSLTQLSSGEKQIVSLFSKLYLEENKNNIIIIDEPELSLSLKWQSMLLPDIMRSGNCNLLLTVTHSPFIFENEFDMDAKEMRKYITEVK